jgi:hypothetical protein
MRLSPAWPSVPKPTHVGTLRVVQDLRRLTNFDQKTTQENGDAVKHLFDHRKIVQNTHTGY